MSKDTKENKTDKTEKVSIRERLAKVTSVITWKRTVGLVAVVALAGVGYTQYNK